LAHWRDLLPKLTEETAELEAEAVAAEKSDSPTHKAAVEAELGDLLFTVVNLGRHLGVDAEMALRGCICASVSDSGRWNWIPRSRLKIETCRTRISMG